MPTRNAIPHIKAQTQSSARHSAIIVPVLPNKPLISLEEKETYGKISLNLNTSLAFVENSSFEPHLITYDRAYQNSQAFSPRFLSHMKDVAALLRDVYPPGTSVVEVGCGKGDFLDLLSEGAHFDVLGFDETYGGSNPRIQKRFLTNNDRIKTDLIILRHTLEHIPSPHQFLELLKNVFGSAPIYIEVPDLDWIFRNQAYIDITYEHVNYFSRESLLKLFDSKNIRSGALFDDQYQYVIAEISDLSNRFLSDYESDHWKELDFYALFPRITETISHIDNLLSTNRKAYVWGAATKGCMFLVHCLQLNKVANKVRFAIDINPNKSGKFLPGSHVPIRDKAAFFASASDGDLVIVSNPSYKDEIVREIRQSQLKNIEVISL